MVGPAGRSVAPHRNGRGGAVTAPSSSAIVTGGSRGLGLVVTEFLARRGYQVVIDGRDEGLLQQVARQFANTVAVPGDVTDDQHRRALVRTAEDRGPLRLLINNASTIGGSPMPSLADFPIDLLERVYDVNVFAPLALSQLALPPLRRTAGLVVNISSDAATGAYPGWGGYGSSKAALDLITRTLAGELEGVGAVSVDPGDMRTQMHQDAFPGEDITDRPEPSVTVPFWAWLFSQDPLAVSGRRFHAQADTWQVPA